MTLRFIIRDEIPEDIDAITDVTISAFENMEISQQTEHFIISALREASALTLSLVAEIDGLVVGHIAFSPVSISDGTEEWHGLGPVSVRPDLQRQGIGKALIWEGLARLRTSDAKGCCLVGHTGYYERFGFENIASLIHEGVPQEVFFAQSFDGDFPEGSVTFHEAFTATG